MIKATIQNSPYTAEMTFPCTEAQLIEWLEELHMDVNDLRPTAVVGSIDPVELSVLNGSEVSIDELNFLAKRLNELDKTDRTRAMAVLGCKDFGIKSELKDIIDLTYNLPRYTLIEDAADLEKAGLTHLLNTRFECNIDRKNKEMLIQEGKNLLDSGKGIQTKYGLVFFNEDVRVYESYNGSVFPYLDTNEKSVITVSINYHGKSERIELPDDDMIIKKALARLGADGLNECTLNIQTSLDIPDDSWDVIMKTKSNRDLFALNGLLRSGTLRLERSELEKMFKNEIIRKFNGLKQYDMCDKPMILVGWECNEFVRIRDNGIMYSENALSKSGAIEYFKISRIVSEIHECCVNYHNAREFSEFSGGCRNVLEFNGFALGVNYDEENGFDFLICRRMSNGDYEEYNGPFDRYNDAKEEFAVESGVVDGGRLFERWQLKNMQHCIKFTLKNENRLDTQARSDIECLNEKISEIDFDDSPKMSM